MPSQKKIDTTQHYVNMLAHCVHQLQTIITRQPNGKTHVTKLVADKTSHKNIYFLENRAFRNKIYFLKSFSRVESSLLKKCSMVVLYKKSSLQKKLVYFRITNQNIKKYHTSSSKYVFRLHRS